MVRAIQVELSEEEYSELRSLKSELHCGSWRGLIYKLRDLAFKSYIKDTQNIFGPSDPLLISMQKEVIK